MTCFQAESYASNRPLADIGEKIFRGRYDEIFSKRNVPLEEAEYLRVVALAGIGQRPYTELRLHSMKYGMVYPSYHNLVNFENSIKFGVKPFLGGVRAELPEMVEVIKNKNNVRPTYVAPCWARK